MRLLLLSLTLMLLAACQQPPIRSDDGQDKTGRLGQLRGPSPADVYIQLAAEYLREGKLDVALNNAQKATIIDPGNPASHNIHALVRQRLGQTALAESAFRSALSADQRDPYALNAYGSFLCGERRYEEADAMFARAVENPLYESPWVALTNAGQCAYLTGRLEQSETYLRNALRRNPRYAPALLRMASVSVETHNFLSARAYLQRFAEVAPHTAESLWLGIRTERELGDQDQFASYALLLRAQFPDSEEVRLLREIESR